MLPHEMKPDQHTSPIHRPTTAHTGDVQVDFPNVAVTQQNMVGEQAQATIGSHPTASLTLTVGVGNIKDTASTGTAKS